MAAYFFFGGVSAGALILAAVAQLMGGEKNRRLVKIAHYVSFATLLPCPPLLIDDLGMPGALSPYAARVQASVAYEPGVVGTVDARSRGNA